MLRVVHKRKISKANIERIWKRFLKGGTSHSYMALTLTHIIEKCEEQSMPYELQAVPGRGYTIKPKPEWKLDVEPGTDTPV